MIKRNGRVCRLHEEGGWNEWWLQKLQPAEWAGFTTQLGQTQQNVQFSLLPIIKANTLIL